MNHFIGHLHTVLIHKKEVYILCKKCGIPMQGICHDLSKFSSQEFLPGVKYWTGDASPQVGERKDLGYSEAWLHHKGRNKHHFEYWTDYVEGKGVCAIQMPNKWFVEMVCDRIAACKVYLGDKYTDSSALEYYYKARSNYLINEKTAYDLETVLKFLALNGEDKTAIYLKENYINNK